MRKRKKKKKKKKKRGERGRERKEMRSRLKSLAFMFLASFVVTRLKLAFVFIRNLINTLIFFPIACSASFKTLYFFILRGTTGYI